MNRLVYSMNEVAAATGQSRPVVYNAIQRGHLRTYLVGKRRFARAEAVAAWIDLLERESDAGRPVIYRGRRAAESEAA